MMFLPLRGQRFGCHTRDFAAPAQAAWAARSIPAAEPQPLATPKASPVTAAGPRTANLELAARPLEAGYSMLMIWLSIAHATAKVASTNLPCACRLAPRARQSNDFG